MSSQPASNKFLELVPQKNGLKIILSAEGKEEIKELREQYPKWNNDDIFFELFDTIRGNSEYDYHPDGGEAGFGLTNAPMITDGYYPSESGRGYDTDYPESAEVYYYDNYMLTDFVEILERDGEVFFDKANKMAGGGTVSDEDVDALSNGYMSAILFTDVDDDQEPLDRNYGTEDFDTKSHAQIRMMARQYILDNREAIEASGLDYDQIGMDVWYAQAGHGVGFFDRNLDKDVEEKLTKGAKKFGDLSHHVFAQDGKVYLEGMKFPKSDKMKTGGNISSSDFEHYYSANGALFGGSYFSNKKDCGGYMKKGGEIWKEYDFETKEEFFDYIDESRINGNFSQLKRLVGELSEDQKREFFRYAGEMGYDETIQYINEKLASGGKVYKLKKMPMTKRGRSIDRKVPAKKAGWRVSKKTGEKYFERRENRSDRSPKHKR